MITLSGDPLTTLVSYHPGQTQLTLAQEVNKEDTHLSFEPNQDFWTKHEGAMDGNKGSKNVV